MLGQPLGVLVLKVAASLWLIAVSFWDHVGRRVPNWLVLPVMFGALVWQVYASIARRTDGLPFVAVSWVVLFLMWRANIFGGGDSKLLMALFAMFPTLQFLILLSVAKVVVSVPLLVSEYAAVGLGEIFRRMIHRVSEKRVLPEPEELDTRGRSLCWTYALPGVLYVWLIA
jgi:hypothetical protein